MSLRAEDFKAAARVAGVSLLAVFTLGPAVYYTHCELQRHRTVRRRKRDYARALAAVGRRRAEGPEGEGVEVELELELREAEREAVRRRYASFKVGGRYQNPFDGWREEGAWEWIFWKLVYRPLTGRLPFAHTPGGVPTGPTARDVMAAALPVEAPDWIHLFGVAAPSDALAPALEEVVFGDAEEADAGGSWEAPGGSSGADESDSEKLGQSWDRLSGSRDGSGSGRSQREGARVPAVGEGGGAPADEGKRIQVSGTFSFTWIGQSTCYVQMDGLCILTDPVFSERTVDSWVGPKRLRPAPCTLKDLVKVDVVVVSHSHYDHLDIRAVKHLGNRPLWIVPKGLKEWFHAAEVYNVREMDWWDTVTVPLPDAEKDAALEILACPTQHWTARTPWDVNASLWSSYSLRSPSASFFHVGDTGYCDVFEPIGRLWGPFDLVACPIGAYEPRWHLAPQHVHPEDSVRIVEDLRGAKAVGVHWGTWVLSDERYDEPPEALRKAVEGRWGGGGGGAARAVSVSASTSTSAAAAAAASAPGPGAVGGFDRFIVVPVGRTIVLAKG